MKKVLSILSMAAVSAMAVSATRVGPVSTYGELKAAVINNKGQLVGSCTEYENKPVQVRGMSLYWSSGADSATTYYSEKAVNLMVKEMKIELVRFAMGLQDSWDHGRGYLGETGKALQLGYLKNIVNAAIDNDIYVIIDWHLEGSDPHESAAIDFFAQAAKDYGQYNNVIFEVYNEPKYTDQGTITSYANKVIKAIRDAGSDNLVLVGSNEWSSNPDQCATSDIQDPANNFACSLHFYAYTHRINGTPSYSERGESAMNSGVPVFVSEWGTTDASGDENIEESSTSQWISWMKQNNVSWANWSASAQPQKSAAFKDITLGSGLNYTKSGEIVKGYLLQDVPTYVNNCGNQSSGEESGFSIGVAQGEETDLIDDMEDGDRYTYLGGWWSAFTDSDDENDGRGGSKVSNSKWKNDFGEEVYDVLMPVEEGGKNTSKYMVGLKGIVISQGEYRYSPYATLGVNLMKDTSAVDLSACQSISYKFKGAEHDFRVETVGVSEGLGNHANYHHVKKDAAEDWKEVELTWDQFTQESWGDDQYHFPLNEGMDKVRRMAWAVVGKEGASDKQNKPSVDYLYVDDVRCNGYKLKAIVGNGSSNISSSSSTGKSSSSINDNSSSSLTGKSSSSTNDISSSSSSLNTIASSSSVSSVKVVMVLDDAEDGDEISNTNGKGTWYAYNDSENGGKSSFSNKLDAELGGYVVNLLGSNDASNGSNGFIGINDIVWNQAEYQYDPFVAIGLNMDADTSKGLDLSSCTALSYRYKGSAHVFKVQDGQVTNFAYHQKRFMDSEEWKEVTVTWDKLTQPSWNPDSLEVNLNVKNIKKVAWEVVGFAGTDEQPETNYLYIDDFKCVDDGSARYAYRKVANTLKLNVQDNMLNVVTASAGRVQVFDMMGNVVANKVLNAAGNHQVSLEGVNRGNYVVRVKTANAVKTARISIR